jgi:hypothetical protein
VSVEMHFLTWIRRSSTVRQIQSTVTLPFPGDCSGFGLKRLERRDAGADA